MATTNLNLPPLLCEAIERRRKETGESLEQIVHRALADYLQVDHTTLYQFSSSTALAEGVYRGEVMVETLREHGDFGLGTFNDLDGEMVVLEGHFYQCRADGSVHTVGEHTRSPFAVITRFAPERSLDLVEAADLGALERAIDELRRSANIFYAIRVDGHFTRVHTRAMARTATGVPLVEAAAHQPEFELHDVDGTLVTFWSPNYAGSLSIPGYHHHFLTQDRSAGGHVLECAGTNLRVQIQHEGDLRLALPTNRSFLDADLSHDPSAALAKAEK